MKRIKQWLAERFLDAYLKAEWKKTKARLEAENQELRLHIRELNAYIDGLELGLRCQRRITINNHMRREPSENKSAGEVTA